MSGPAPDKDLLLRHDAAMKVIPFLAPEQRVSLLAAVVAPSPYFWWMLERGRRLDEEEAA
jgi:hypothetical protein